MNIERHGHVVPMDKKAKCGGPAICKVCQREQDYEDGRKWACMVTRPYRTMYQGSMNIGAVEEHLTAAFMAGREKKGGDA